MKKMMIVLALLVVTVNLVAAEELVWCGLDYSHVKLTGNTDLTGSSLPRLAEAWNTLFIHEQLTKLEKMAGTVRADTEAAGAANSKVTDKSVRPADAPAITEKEIAAIVKGYKLQAKEGLGLVFVVDQLAKSEKLGTAGLQVVFFDVKSRKVLLTEHKSEKATGIGPRNYWFGAIKKVLKDLPSQYQKAKATK
jgi:hypothetical protein